MAICIRLCFTAASLKREKKKTQTVFDFMSFSMEQDELTSENVNTSRVRMRSIAENNQNCHRHLGNNQFFFFVVVFF